MRVLCIDASNHPSSKAPCDLVEGQIYTVISEDEAIDVYGKIEMCYSLEGTDQFYAYAKSRFIPVSDIDETEMVRELQTVKQD